MARTGRPSKINDVVATRPVLDAEGNPTGETTEITVADQIVADVRTGMYADRAARRAGITTRTFYEWEKIGRETQRRLDAGEITASKLRAYERRCLDFSLAIEQAEVEWETRANADLERIARGGIPQRETIVKVGTDGQEIERRTKESHTLPDAAVIMKRLALRFPDRYTARVQVEGTGEGGEIPVDVRIRNLGDALRDHLERNVDESEGARA